MIRSFKNKGLAEFSRTGSTRRLSVQNLGRVERLIRALMLAKSPEEMNFPGNRFHELIGHRSGTYSIRVTGNWRITFEWDGEDAINVDLEDYH